MAIISTDIYQVTPNRTIGLGCIEGKCSCPTKNSGLGDVNDLDNVSQYDISKYGSGSVIIPIDSNSWYCNSTLGQFFSPGICHIPSVQEVNADWAKEMATTSAPKSAIDAAAILAADSVAADMRARPQDYIDQNVAANYPVLGSLLGPEIVGTLMGTTPSGVQGQGSISPWLVYGLLGLGVLLLVRR